MIEDRDKKDEASDESGSAGAHAYRELTEKPASEKWGWRLMMTGFGFIILAGLLFLLHRNHPLQYETFALNANLLGKYFLMAGFFIYIVGRILSIMGRARRRK